MNRTTQQESRLVELTEEYISWMRTNGLALGSAYEHVNDDWLRPEQREWLRQFCARWESASK